MTDKELGSKVFYSFWNWNRTFYPNNFKLTYSQFLESHGKKKDIYIDGVGGGVRESKISDSRIDSAMRSLALASQGRMLSNPQKMFDFMMNENAKIDWVDAGSFVLIQSGKDVIGGAEQLGNSLIKTGKILNFILPAVLIIVVLFWVNSVTGGSLSKTAKGLRR